MTAIFSHRLVFIAAIVAAMLLSQMALFGANNPTQSLVTGENSFAFDLYGRLKGGDGNLFFSPYSISTGLGMAYVGARGETARQMAKVLHFEAAPSDLPTPMGALEKQLNELRQVPNLELNTANGLWAQSGHPFLPAYMEIVRQQFSAQINQADFRTEAEPTRKIINGWVATQTRDKIKDLIPPGKLDASTYLVLVNAIYFKGRWKDAFKSHETADAPFTVSAKKSVQARMMHQTASFAYAETEEAQLLEMDYVSTPPGGQLMNTEPLSMVILLPKQNDGLAKLESSLSDSSLGKWLDRARLQRVEVFVPKFKLTEEFNLTKTLANMGMGVAFSRAADFSGMDGEHGLFISDVFHKAFVDVNEEGTEAAAATGVLMSRSLVMKPNPVPVFRADHPFIFLIRDTRSGSILFLGRVTDPTK